MRSIHSKLFLTGLIATVGLLSLGATSYVTGRAVLAIRHHSQPFLLVLRVSSLADGETKHVADITAARNSRGVVANWAQNPRVPIDLVSRQIVLPDGHTVELLDREHVKTSGYISDKDALAAVIRRSQAGTDCVPDNANKSIVGRTRLFDEDVEIVRKANGQLRFTRWLAPALGCATIRYTIEHRQPDGTYAVSTVAEPISLSHSEPPPAIFDEHPDYAELRPSAVRERFRHAMGVPDSAVTAQRLDELRKRDEVYDTLRGLK